LTCAISEERVRKGAEKLVKSLNTKQQGRLDGFFTATPRTSAPKASAKDAKGKNDKGKGTKRKVSYCITLALSCELYRLTYPVKTEDKDEAKASKKSKAKK
jgi:hypothetical protein